MEIDYKKAREELRRWAVKYTAGCEIQDNWPCGTCFVHLLEKLGLDNNHPAYHEHNKPVDRTNEVWRAILQIRENKKGSEKC